MIDAVACHPLVGAVVWLTAPRCRLETTTDSLGQYRIVNVVVGSYEFTVTADGYETLVIDDIPVTAGLVTRQINLMQSKSSPAIQSPDRPGPDRAQSVL